MHLILIQLLELVHAYNLLRVVVEAAAGSFLVLFDEVVFQVTCEEAVVVHLALDELVHDVDFDEHDVVLVENFRAVLAEMGV